MFLFIIFLFLFFRNLANWFFEMVEAGRRSTKPEGSTRTRLIGNLIGELGGGGGGGSKIIFSSGDASDCGGWIGSGISSTGMLVGGGVGDGGSIGGWAVDLAVIDISENLEEISAVGAAWSEDSVVATKLVFIDIGSGEELDELLLIVKFKYFRNL